MSDRGRRTAKQEGIEVVRDGDLELARVIRTEYSPTKTTFVTPDHFRQQLGFIVHGTGTEIKRHRHNPIRREIIGTPEVIFVRSGHCIVDIYGEKDSLIASKELKAGDVIVFAAGGHGFRMLEDTTLLEVKQGPYSPEGDKVHF